MRASRAENELSGSFCQLGPASARIEINIAAPASQRPPPRDFSLAWLTLNQRNRCGSQTAIQSPEGLRARFHNQGRNTANGNNNSQ